MRRHIRWIVVLMLVGLIGTVLVGLIQPSGAVTP